MQTLNTVQTLYYDLDCQKMSTDDKTIVTKNVNTSSTEFVQYLEFAFDYYPLYIY